MAAPLASLSFSVTSMPRDLAALAVRLYNSVPLIRANERSKIAKNRTRIRSPLLYSCPNL